MKTLSGHEIAEQTRANPGAPSGDYVPAAVAGELLAILKTLKDLSQAVVPAAAIASHLRGMELVASRGILNAEAGDRSPEEVEA